MVWHPVAKSHKKWLLGAVVSVVLWALAPTLMTSTKNDGAHARSPPNGAALVLPVGWRRRDPSCKHIPRPEVLELPPAGECAYKDALGVVVIPGNPGIPHFYCEFGKQLQELLGSAGTKNVAVYVIGYSNFITDAPRGTPVRSIVQEKDIFGEVIEDLGRDHAGGGLALVGHSIGGWCIAQLVEQAWCNGCGPLQGADVRLAVLAMPYLEFDATPGSYQSKLHSILSRSVGAAAIRCLAFMLAALPNKLQAWLVPVLTGVDPGYDSTVVLETFGKHRHHLEAVAMMGLTEFRQLDPRKPGQGITSLEPLFLARKRPKLLALVAKDDEWCQEIHANRLQQMFASAMAQGAPEAKLVDLEDQAQHAFVLSSKQSLLVAKTIVNSM